MYKRQQLNFKIAQIKTQLTNALTGVGLLLLPTISDVANWVTNTTAYLQKHPLVSSIASDAVLAAFGLALSTKMAGAGIALAKSFGTEVILTAPEIGAAIAAFIAIGFSLKNLIVDPVKKALTDLNNFFTGGGGIPGSTSSPTPTKPPSTTTTTAQPQWQMVDNLWITKQQSAALDKLVKTDKNQQDYINALNNFAAQDQKGNYSVKIKVTR